MKAATARSLRKLHSTRGEIVGCAGNGAVCGLACTAISSEIELSNLPYRITPGKDALHGAGGVPVGSVEDR